MNFGFVLGKAHSERALPRTNSDFTSVKCAAFKRMLSKGSKWTGGWGKGSEMRQGERAHEIRCDISNQTFPFVTSEVKSVIFPIKP